MFQENYEGGNYQFFQISLKFVKWHLCIVSSLSKRTMSWLSRLCFLWELCEVNFKSDSTQTFPHNCSSWRWGIFMRIKHLHRLMKRQRNLFFRSSRLWGVRFSVPCFFWVGVILGTQFFLQNEVWFFFLLDPAPIYFSAPGSSGSL